MNLPHECWGEAVSTANYRWTRRTTGVARFERSFGKISDLKNLKVFGESVFVNVPKVQRNKFSEKSIEMVFVRYDTNFKVFRMVDKDFKFTYQQMLNLLVRLMVS